MKKNKIKIFLYRPNDVLFWDQYFGETETSKRMEWGSNFRENLSSDYIREPHFSTGEEASYRRAFVIQVNGYLSTRGIDVVIK